MIGGGEIAYRETGPAIRTAGNAQMVIAMDTVEQVARSFHQAGVRLGVLYVMRYNAEIVCARKLVERDAVGCPSSSLSALQRS